MSPFRKRIIQQLTQEMGETMIIQNRVIQQLLGKQRQLFFTGAFLTSFFIIGCDGGSTASSQTASSEVATNSSSSLSVTSSSEVSSSTANSSSINSVISSSSSPNTSNELPVILAINAGGNSVDNGDFVFEADRFYQGGMTSQTTDAISGTVNDAIYQSERYGDYRYEIPVTEGDYQVELHFAEIYHETNGAREFHVDIEGTRVITSADLHALAGHDGAYSYLADVSTVNDGALSISLTGVNDNATLSAFIVMSSNGEIDNTPPPMTDGGPNSVGFIGCSMAENTATGYRAIGGEKMWGPYGTNGDVVQNWTDNNSAAWQRFDQQVAMYGKPQAVWVQICIFNFFGVTYDEVKSMIANARSHAADNATIYISGQPVYDPGLTCDLAGSGGPELTDSLAEMAGNDAALDVIYVGQFGPLSNGDRSDSCHANTTGQRKLGQQAAEYFGL